MKNHRLNYLMISVAGLLFLFQANRVLSGQVSAKTATQTVPLSSPAETVPLSSTPETITLPSTSMEYQHVDKPPVKKLDIPDYDIAAEFRLDSVEKLKASHNGKHRIIIRYQIALMNKGSKTITRAIPIKIRLINTSNNTLFRDQNSFWNGSEVRTDYWAVGDITRIDFRQDVDGAPHEIRDVKLILDVDPDNTFKEARQHRGNNRCVVITW